MNNSFCVKDVDGGVAIVKYQGSLAGDGDVVIPSQIDGKNVVAIAGNAFNRSDHLKSVVIPDGVKTIEDGNDLEGAFGQCRYLERVVLPSTLEVIGDQAFSDCASLKDVVIPERVRRIGKYAFAWCASFTADALPESVREIEEGAFSYCNALSRLVLPKGIVEIAQSAFDNCGLIEVDPNNENYCSEDGVLFNKSKTRLLHFPVNSAFDEYIVPSTVEEICEGAFADASTSSNLRSVVIPEGVKIIGMNAFFMCWLKKLVIPKSVEEIGDEAFEEGPETVYVYPDSYAEEWANNNLADFVVIGYDPDEDEDDEEEEE